MTSERYVHFLVKVTSGLPQRCRVSLRVLATLDGTCPISAQLEQATRLFLKHHRMIESLARRKLSSSKEPMKWVTIAANDLDPTGTDKH